MMVTDQLLAKQEFIKKLVDAGATSDEAEREFGRLKGMFAAKFLSLAAEGLNEAVWSDMTRELKPEEPEVAETLVKKVADYLAGHPMDVKKLEELAREAALGAIKEYFDKVRSFGDNSSV